MIDVKLRKELLEAIRTSVRLTLSVGVDAGLTDEQMYLVEEAGEILAEYSDSEGYELDFDELSFSEYESIDDEYGFISIESGLGGHYDYEEDEI